MDAATNTDSRWCRLCETTLPLTAFYPSDVRSGAHRCGKCRAANNEAWRAANRERVNANERKRIAALPEETRRARWQAHYQKHKSENNARATAWRKSNPERSKRYHAQWARENAKRLTERRYGLLPGQYDALLAAQGGACAICRRTDNFDRRRFAIDHCHETGRVRGLLCTKCNVAVGLLRDDPDMAERATLYLRGEGK